jgi:NADH-quinone oxidoreductase subunit L
LNPLHPILIVLLPLAGFVLCALTGRSRTLPGWIATTLMFAAMTLSLITAYMYFFEAAGPGGYEILIPFETEWLRFTDTLTIRMGILLDPASVMMLVLVTVVSFLVHLYSVAYMKGQERYGIFFSFLSLFTFSMLGLVVATNIFQTYVFWELVGVSSYLLIGFYYQRPSAVSASKKAFIVTRFADLGFLIGILILSFYAATFDFTALIASYTDPASAGLQAAVSASFLGLSAITWGLLLVFAGGAGKSAMFPLHIWLPDAMEGPTPVSALIHAATMVVAGVYLVARLFPVFVFASPVALDVVTWTGLFSALLAAVIACSQTDIKRILAYSTMSQIGFMMFALGISGYGGEAGLGYTASLFHLFTHAFFKALLFLCAGVIIHQVHSNSISDMGGLKRSMPFAHITFLIACLAIAGIPPFAGFFSKEEILLAAWQSGPALFIPALITSGLTAFYMFRLYYSVFYGKKTDVHPSPVSALMKWPLAVLAMGAIAAGFIPFGRFVSSDGQPLETELHLNFAWLPVGLSVAGILLAAWLYKNAGDRPARWGEAMGLLGRTAREKFYMDEIYLFVTKKVVFNLIARPAAWFDRHIVDGAMNMLGKSAEVFSMTAAPVQSGKVQAYAAWMLAGTIGMLLLLYYIFYLV